MGEHKNENLVKILSDSYKIVILMRKTVKNGGYIEMTIGLKFCLIDINDCFGEKIM